MMSVGADFDCGGAFSVFDNPDNVFFVDSLGEPVHDGCRRQVATYDNGEAIYWVDVPYGTRDWEPMYLCTEAARLYMMSDAEFDEYERQCAHEDLLARRSKVRHAMPLGICVALCAVLAVACCVTCGPVAALVVVGVAALVFVLWAIVASGQAVGDLIGTRGGPDRDAVGDLEAFSGDALAMSYARECASQVRRAEERVSQVESSLSELFSEGSLTWHRYDDALRVALSRMRDNAGLMSDVLLRASGSSYGVADGRLAQAASRILSDNGRVLESVCGLCARMDDMASAAFVERSTGVSEDVADELSSLGDELVLYRG